LAAQPEPPRPRPGIGAAVAAAERKARRSLLRGHGGGHAPVSFLELFFDLVFVFAITQLSHFFGHHIGWLGFVEGLVLFLALWWAWMYTTWVTNWVNPDRLPVRLMLLALMVLSLGMAVSLPKAFAGNGLVFAVCYVALQLGRSLWVAWAFAQEKAHNARNMVRISLWFCASAPLWIGGAMAGGVVQLACWLIALGIEYLGPFLLYAVPGMGRSKTSDWDISGSHMAERCSLFIIIALGEGIVVTGATFVGGPADFDHVTAALAAFFTSALMWWLYFDIGAERGTRLIAGHAQVGRIARNAYTYLHMPIVLGIVIAAVGDALLLESPQSPASNALVAMQTGGALLFLVGLGLFKRHANTMGNFPMSHSVAVLLVAALGLAGWSGTIPALRFAGLGAAILLLAAVWEWVSYHGGWLERAEALGLPVPASVKERGEQRRARIEAERG
jgi:low temperature requirement protein LtrA